MTLTAEAGTSDLTESAALLTAGLKVQKIEKTNGKVFFYFAPFEKAKTIREKYWKGELRQNPLALGLNQRLLKDVIFRGAVS